MGLRTDTTVREALVEALEEDSGAQDFTAQERSLLQNVLDVSALRVQDAMVPRADIIAVQAEATLADVMREFRAAGHSRLPVYGESLDDPWGMIHIRDFIDFLVTKSEKNTNVAPGHISVDLTMTLGEAIARTKQSDHPVMRPVLFAPPSMPVMDLLVKMQATRTHMALVIDEYGGTDGLASMEDIMEMIVGDIEDEHDDEEDPEITEMGPGVYLIDARADLDAVSDITGVKFDEIEVAEEVDTIGGLIVTLAGRVPDAGERIPGPLGLVFDILEADSRRLKQLRLSINGAESTEHNGNAGHEPAAVFDLTRERRNEGQLSATPRLDSADEQPMHVEARTASGN